MDNTARGFRKKEKDEMASEFYLAHYRDVDSAEHTVRTHSIETSAYAAAFAGKIGLALIETKPAGWHLKLLLMSCRVMSRGVGSVLLSHIMQQAREHGVRLLADFRHTDRNRMMHIAYRFADFTELSRDEDGRAVLENDLSRIQPFPSHLKVEVG